LAELLAVRTLLPRNLAWTVSFLPLSEALLNEVVPE
jgi:hypothetical protein